jgi:bifunctional non-homologous end joining protein LigD
MGDGTTVDVDGRRVTLTNLDKVLYPDTGTTKAEVIDYYARIGSVLVDHTAGRCMTMRRYPNGVEGASFFEKRCPSHRPDWVPTAVGPGDRKGELRYCRFDEPAALVWAANLAALELHAPMARSGALDTPLACVFDLDPGPGTAIPECARLALAIGEVLAATGLEAVAKTSGSKGLQVYVPLNTTDGEAHTHEECSAFALAVGQLLEKRDPAGVTVTMARSERPGRVFVDWSQNAFHKTTVCVYSMRARPRPTVSTPVSWDEVADAADGRDPLVFEIGDVLERVADRGDLFAPVLELAQRLPRPRPAP